MSEAFDPYYTWLGIHPEDQPPDHYRLLGLRKFEANPDVISNAADRQMMMVRSFQSGPRSKESQQILNQISTAKVCLLNPQHKRDYDRQLAAATTSRDSSPAARPAPKPAAQRKVAARAAAAPSPQIVVKSDPRPSVARPGSQRPAWQKPALIGGAVVAVLALIIITAVTLAVSSNNTGTPVASPDQASADSPAGLANVEPEPVATADTQVADANPAANQAADNATITSPKVDPSPSTPKDVSAALLPRSETQFDDFKAPTTPAIAAPDERTVANVQPTGKPVDLLALIDADRDVKRGQFVRQGNELVSVAGSVHIRYQFPDEYVLTAEVTRLQEDDALLVGLVIGDQPCMHLIDGFLHDGPCSGLELVDGKRVPENPTRRDGQFLHTGKSAKIVYTVRNDRLTVTVDNNIITQWDDDPSRLQWHSFFRKPSDRNPFIGSWDAVFRFSKLEVAPLGGEAVVTPVAGTSPEEASEPVKRLAAPDGEKQKVVLGQVKEIFKDEYAAATSPEGRTALAERLIEQSGEAGLEAAAQFVLLREAYKYAAEAVQPDVAFQSADQLGRQFEIDPLELKIKAVSDMEKAAWDADSRKRLASAAMALSRECLLDDRAPEAEKLSELAEDAATRSRDGQLRIEARTWHADVRQFVKQWNIAEGAKKVLAATPDDAEANTQLGRFLCLTMDDWEKGLPHLVKTDRANLRQLAEMELAAPQAATDKVELADAWWEAAKSAVSDEKDAYQRRARHWYQAALTELAGLQKIKVEKRLQTLADVGESLLLARNDIISKPVAPPERRPQPPVGRPIAPPREVNPQPAEDDTNRAAAQWVMSLKGDGSQQLIKSAKITLRLPNKPRITIRSLEEIPKADFDINEISIRNANIADDDLHVFLGVRQLYGAFLPNSPISDRGLQYFKNCPLGHLTVCGNVTDAGIQFIADTFHQMGNLSLNDTQITDAGLAHLRNYVQLHLLDVGRTKVTDAGLAHLANLQRLKFLTLDETSISDEGLKHVAQLKLLESVSLKHTNITVDGLRPLASLPNLKYLWLQHTFTLADIEPIRPLFPPRVAFPNLR